MISQTQSLLSIDGSLGEGGGQVLRTSLALITSRPFALTNIRSRRSKPGLMPQHLKAVEAARAIGKAKVEGALLGSQFLAFEPAGLSAGDFHFDIGTAGSTSLVLQTILPPLSFAAAGSTITLTGGTQAIDVSRIRLPSPSKGSLLLLLAEFENSQCCSYGLGALGKPAERVADEAVDELLGFLATDGAIDPYVADQLLPLSLAAGISEIRTSKVQDTSRRTPK